MQLPPRRRSSAGDCPIGAPLNPVVTSMHRWGSEPIVGSQGLLGDGLTRLSEQRLRRCQCVRSAE
ncbi:hypothetical protein MINT15_16610 [Saccharomonospora viridis]|uniref:Uncharacterized protein n=1 Tax=Saccharomonospora viridis TaxID=1852 RepID=A0A837DA79_9PSEU|nr:hypothetical protein MINT15_16610 [Saccharomonospora viridis]